MRGIRQCAARPRRAIAVLSLAALCLALCPAALPHPGIHERIAAVSREIHEHPRDAALYLRRGELRRLHGEFAAAEADYGWARQLDPDLATVDLCLGSLRDDQGRFAEAVVAFDRYIAARPGDPAGHSARARVLSKLGRHVEAAAGLTRAIDAAAQSGQIPSPDWYDERALELLAAGSGRSQEALAGIEAGIERLGGPVALELRAVELEQSLGRFDAALARLDRVAAASGEGATAGLERQRAGILERAGRTDDARSAGAPAPRRAAAAPRGRGATPAIEAATQETVFVQAGSGIRYRANASDPGIGLAWTAEGFADDGWTPGLYGVGYESAPPGAQALLQTTVAPGTYSLYTRARFTVAEAAQVTSLFLGADYDDGYIAWLNGVEVFRSSQMPAGPPAWNTNASSHESSNGASPGYLPLRDITEAGLPALHDGENVLAVGVWNSGAPSSTDLVLVPKLGGNKAPALTRGPYLQLGTPSSVVVRWRTDVATDSVVRYGAAPAGLASSVSDPVPTTEHIVTLSGLDPAARYFYSVGSSAATFAGGDPDHAFTTSPPPGAAGPWRLWVVGDSGTADANARAVRDAYDAFAGPVPTDLWLMLGDNAYPDGTDAEYQSAVFDMYPRLLAQSVLWPTYGNHDGHSADSPSQTGPYYDIFTLPAAAQAGGAVSGTEAYYSFDFGNVHFICLDSYETSRAPGSPMMTWLALDLLGTTKDWIIAFWHHPPYTKGSHDSDSEVELIEMRQSALPLLEARGVDLVLCGHSHSFERSYLLDGHYGLSTTFSDANKKDGGDGRADGTGAYHKPTTGPAAHEGAVYSVAGSSGQISGGRSTTPRCTSP